MIASIFIRVITRLLAWALYRSLRRHVPRPDLKALIDRELAEVSTSIRCFADNQTSEVGILTQRLGRRFDPGMALNESANRALEQKAAYGEGNLHAVTGEPAELTKTQLKALEFQKQYVKRVIGSAPATPQGVAPRSAYDTRRCGAGDPWDCSYPACDCQHKA